MNTSILAEELSQLSTQIEQTRQKHDALLAELRVVDAEVETFADDRQRFDALRDVCGSLDKLQDLNAGELFWDGVANTQNAAKHLERVRKRIALFDDDIKDILEKKASLQGQINQCRDDLAILDEEVRESYDREARRAEEYVIEREFSEVPNRSMAMPWRKDTESEQRFRKLLRYAFLFYVVFCIIVVLWKLPPPDRPVVAVVPERLVSMLRKEPPKPAPVPDRSKEKTMDKAQEKELKNRRKIKLNPHKQMPSHQGRRLRPRVFWRLRMPLRISSLRLPQQSSAQKHVLRAGMLRRVRHGLADRWSQGQGPEAQVAVLVMPE